MAAVVSVLIATVLPAASLARASARRAGCLSNLRTLGIVWTQYTEDYRAFPCGDLPSYRNHLRFGWGGVSWYGDNPVPGIHTPPDRPLNAYVSTGPRIETRMELFKCPSDTGCANSVSGERSWAAHGAGNASGEGAISCFGLAGTSYEANTWMYCIPGSTTGFGYSPPGTLPPRFRGNQTFDNMSAEPWRFIVIGEIGAMAGGRMGRAERGRQDVFTGFWHGAEKGQFVFADGSARTEAVGSASTPRYTCFMALLNHPGGAWRWPDRP